MDALCCHEGTVRLQCGVLPPRFMQTYQPERVVPSSPGSLPVQELVVQPSELACTTPQPLDLQEVREGPHLNTQRTLVMQPSSVQELCHSGILNYLPNYKNILQ